MIGYDAPRVFLAGVVIRGDFGADARAETCCRPAYVRPLWSGAEFLSCPRAAAVAPAPRAIPQ